MRTDFVTVGPHETLFETYQLMRLARLRHVFVTDGTELRGALTYRDLLEQFLLPGEAGPRHSETTAVTEAMTPSPFCVTPDTPIDDAARRIVRLRVGCLPVVDEHDGRVDLVGLLTELDLIRAAYEHRLRAS